MTLPDQRPLIAPSLLSSNFVRLAEEIEAVEAAGADLLHIDVMDGHFVPNLTLGPPVIKSIKSVAKLPLDVHLMIANADRYITEYRDAGADILTVHQEASIHLHRVVQAIKSAGMDAGVSINPATPVSTLVDILPFVDQVLIMSVNPGFGGQAFIEQSYAKISTLRAMATDIQRNDLRIEVDGGVDANIASTLVERGADMLVSGSAIFSSGDYKEYIAKLRN